MDEMKFVDKKMVDIRCYRPFHVNRSPFSGNCFNVIADMNIIRIALENKAKVSEVMKDGSRIPLDFANYNIYNGPNAADPDDKIVTKIDPDNVKIENVTKDDVKRHEEGLDAAEFQPPTQVIDDPKPVVETEKEVVEQVATSPVQSKKVLDPDAINAKAMGFSTPDAPTEKDQEEAVAEEEKAIEEEEVVEDGETDSTTGTATRRKRHRKRR